MPLKDKFIKQEEDTEKSAQDNMQYNAQDLDQEQNVEVNPVQLNTQSVRVLVRGDAGDYSGTISGTTFMATNQEIVPGVRIYLFFGNESRHPVYKTTSDQDGNFVIEALPPGYYCLHARFKEHFWFESYSIKVLPCQNAYQSILLRS